MNNELNVLLREILGRMDWTKTSRPDPADVRTHLKEKGISDKLIDDAMLLLEVINQAAEAARHSPIPTRVLSAEEVQDLNPAVVGKLFRLYYLGYMKKDDLETVMTNLMFVPQEFQDDRARSLVASMMRISPAQAQFIFDGGLDSSVVH